MRCDRNFHYGDANGKYKACIEAKPVEDLPNWNQQQSESARSKIRTAIADLLNKDSLPSGATERFKKLLQYRIGGGSLYRHKDLWHPQFLNLKSEASSITEEEICHRTAIADPPSLLSGNGGNVPVAETFTATETNPPPTVMLACARGINAETWQATLQAAVQRIQQSPTNLRQIEQIQQYLGSGNPILIAEAISWFQAFRTIRH